MRNMSISGRMIGSEHMPYVIAEVSANHNGSLYNVFKIIDQAKSAGADAIKIQTYTADSMTIDCESNDFTIDSGPWKGKTLYQLYEWAHTPLEWHKSIFEYAATKKITLFSSPFDSNAIDLLEDLNCPAYKIASFEAVDLPLISYAASTGKPIIISTGMINEHEIDEAVNCALDSGCKNIALLHCISSYPTLPEDFNLKTISMMLRKYNIPVGLSDHSISNVAAIASISLGSSIIEKHFKIDSSESGPDHFFSLNKKQFSELCDAVAMTKHSLGHERFMIRDTSSENYQFRRSIYFVKDMLSGDVITSEHVRIIRPGYGLEPKYLNDIIGRTMIVSRRAGESVTWECIK